MKKSRAFTLIELLVVVAIIGLLIAIIVPSLGIASRKVKTARCATQVRGLAQSVQIYVADWGRMLAFSQNADGSWVQILGNRPANAAGGNSGYGGSAKLNTCPSAPLPESLADLTVGTAHSQWYGSIAGTTLSGSYAMNGFMYNYPDTQADSIGTLNSAGCSVVGEYYNYQKISSASETPLFCDANWRHFWANPSDQPPQAPYNLDNNGPSSTGSVTSPNTLIHPLQRAIMDRHQRGINVSFVDGHTELVKLPKLWSLRWYRGWVPPITAPMK